MSCLGNDVIWPDLVTRLARDSCWFSVVKQAHTHTYTRE